MLRRLLALLGKEYRQIFQDLPILFILVYAFTGALYVAGHAMSMEVRNYPLAVLDLTRSPLSRDLVERLRAPAFKIVRHADSDAELVRLLDTGQASAALVIPPDFDRLAREGTARVQLISDGTLSMAATIAAAQIAAIAASYAHELLVGAGIATERDLARLPQIELRPRIAFNANLTTSWFTSLLELLNITTMVSALLTASAMVREKEYGTLDQLMVSPLRPAELFIAKILPTVSLILLLSCVGLYGVIRGVFETPIRGSVPFFLAVSAFYVFSAASLGLAIAVMARNVAQAMLMLLLFLFPMMFLSGAHTPPESMAPLMAWLSLLSPMRYYIDFGYQVLFKGNGLAEVWPDILGILAVGCLFFAFAIVQFRRLLRGG